MYKVDKRYKKHLDFEIGQMIVSTLNPEKIGRVVLIKEEKVWINIGSFDDREIMFDGAVWYRPATYGEILLKETSCKDRCNTWVRE